MMSNVTTHAAVNDSSMLCHNLQQEHATVFDASGPWFWLFVGSYIIVVVFAGLMSGLTLAIFSLDLTGLKVLQVAGSNHHRKCASRIMPLAQRQHLVLVSLVLANALAVEAMPLLLDRISSPLIAIVVSVTAVLIFGEVLPQAICGRHGLTVGYYLAWLVWSVICIEFVITYPISLILESILGKSYGTFYRRSELKALVDFHGPKKAAKSDSQTVMLEEARAISDERLTLDEVLIIKGALELTTKKVKAAMLKLDDVFMLSVDACVDFKALTDIMEDGHSRVPIYSKHRENLIGVFLTKRLIIVDPNKRTPVKDLISDKRFFYPAFWVDENMPLYVLLNKFQEGASTHMAFVCRNKPNGKYELLGIVTLEDVLEEILQEEIYDEVDAYKAVAKRIHLARANAMRAIKIGPKKAAANKTPSPIKARTEPKLDTIPTPAATTNTQSSLKSLK